jgi:lipid A 4'-phosphatase
MRGCRLPPIGWMPGAFMRGRVLVLLALAAAVFAAFALWPGLDLWVSGLFYNSAGGFDRFASGGWNLIRLAIWRASEMVLALSILALLAGEVLPALRASRSLWLYITLLYLTGPGLLVDVLLKPLWGRARPAEVQEFGGTLAFTPPHLPSGQCSSNCSFVAGEVSGAVALAVALALLLSRPNLTPLAHRAAIALITLLPLYTGFQRIAAGRHFLSDVLLSAIFTLLCAVLLMALIRPKTGGGGAVDNPPDSPYTART